MGRPPCCDKSNVKKGLWTAEEDAKILAYVAIHGVGNWSLIPKKAGLNRCGKSCRLRWTNYLRPDLKHDSFSPQEEELIVECHRVIGSRWSSIARKLPGRTDNDVKNHWNTKLKKRLMKMGIDPVTHKPVSQVLSEFRNISGQSETFVSNFKTEPSQSNSAWGMMRRNDSPMPMMFTNPFTTCSSSSASIQAPPTTFCWTDFLLPDPFLPLNSQSQVVAHKESHHNENFNCSQKMAPGTCHSATSFVDEILDKDQEMLSQFPQLLNDLDY